MKISQATKETAHKLSVLTISCAVASICFIIILAEASLAVPLVETSSQSAQPSALKLFLGRFHPLIVHLPIGFLILGFLMELFSRIPRFVQLQPATNFTFVLGTVSAIAAVVTGLFLSEEGGYNDTTLSLHKWMGIAVAVTAIIITVLKLWPKKSTAPQKQLTVHRAYTIVLFLNIILISAAGHFGGTLTHGSTFLTEHLPQPFRAMAGLAEKSAAPKAKSLQPETAIIYTDIIQPIFDEKCITCHNPDKRKGKLILTSAEEVAKGGENGPIIAAGDTEESEIHYRITVPEDDMEHMPPDGKKQLTENEIRLIEWWIMIGGAFDQPLREATIPDDIKAILNAISNSNKEPETSFFDRRVPLADSVAIDTLRAAGVLIMPVSQQTNFIRAGFRNTSNFSARHLQLLMPLSEQLTWLDLAFTGITDKDLAIISTFPNITRLHLEKTAISDAGLAHLDNLSFLEYLNLYGTGITDAGLDHLSNLTELTSLYLWQTKVTADGIDRLQRRLPQLQINTGELALHERPQLQGAENSSSTKGN